MIKQIADTVPEIVSRLEILKTPDINAFLGFDACIDNISRVVKENADNNEQQFYTNSRHFGEYLIEHENRSCGIELNTQLTKIGGNMVISANALGILGVKSDCIGTFGLPEILPIFQSMSGNCKLYTVGEIITTTALEFNDAKVMLFDPGFYKRLDWNGIKDILGIERLRLLFSGKQLVMLLNWSEIENSSEIWKGIIDEVLPFVKYGGIRPILLTDFSDCSRRTLKEIVLAIDLFIHFRKYYKVIFSLNQNEAEIISEALNLPRYTSDEDLIKMLFHSCLTDEIVIHRSKDALAFDGITLEKCDTFYCKEPAILTGGGDNFNAGYCLSKFYNFTLIQSLIVANAVSGYYVKTRRSPDIGELVNFLKENSLD